MLTDLRHHDSLSSANLRAPDPHPPLCALSSLPVSRPKPSGVLPIPPRSAPKGVGSGVDGGREGHSTLQADSLRREGARRQQIPRTVAYGQPRQVVRRNLYAADTMHADSRARNGGVGSRTVSSESGQWVSHRDVGTGRGNNAGGSPGWHAGSSGSGGGGRGVDASRLGSGSGAGEGVKVAAQKVAAADETFGAMAPCWRLLERAKAYMEHVRSVAT